MLNMETKTKLGRDEIKMKMNAFFGPGGLGLELSEKGDDCYTYSGGGGFVEITLCDGDRETTVNMMTREWEIQVKKFAGMIS